jgi:hypothetical protein
MDRFVRTNKILSSPNEAGEWNIAKDQWEVSHGNFQNKRDYNSPLISLVPRKEN